MEIPFSGQIDVDILRRTNRAALTPTRGKLLFLGLVVLFAGWGVVAPAFQGGAIAFPREFFASEGDWRAFVGLVRENVPERPAAGPGRRFGAFKVFLLWLVVFA